MSLSENGNGNGMVMPVGPMYGNGGGMGFFGGEGGFFYLIILFLFFLFVGNGWGNNGYGNEYSGTRGRSTVTGRFVSRGASMNDPYSMDYGMNSYYGRGSYEMGRSGHSTKDRMIAALENVMGEVKNDYEADMVRQAIASIQSSN